MVALTVEKVIRIARILNQEQKVYRNRDEHTSQRPKHTTEPALTQRSILCLWHLSTLAVALAEYRSPTEIKPYLVGLDCGLELLT